MSFSLSFSLSLSLSLSLCLFAALSFFFFPHVEFFLPLELFDHIHKNFIDKNNPQHQKPL